MSQRIQLRRGIHDNLPNSGLLTGEPLITTDRSNLFVAKDATTRGAVTPAIDALTALAGINGAEDLLIVHDADGVGQKEKRITFNAFKAALAIPDASTDEKVSVVSGGTPGYIYGTDGTDGVMRLGPSLAWALDGSNGFVTLAVDVVDGGTF
jgi:hypothetical protein